MTGDVGKFRFTGRGWLIDQIDAFLDDQPCGYVWIEADAGMGKTALAAHLAGERGWISHFSRDADGGSVRTALRALAAQLITDRVLPERAGTPEGFEALLTKAASGDRIVLVVDGAEEAVTPLGWQPWGLPRVLPPNVFVVGTCRTGTRLPGCDVPRAVIHLRADDERNLTDLSEHTQHPDLAARCGGSWLYARHVLDEIRLESRGADDELPADLRSYYLDRLDRWRAEEDWPDVALPVLSTLAVAHSALPLDTLSRMSGVDEQAVREWCDRRLRPFLVSGTYDLCLREVWSELLGSAAVEAHSRIADHCLAHLDDDYSVRYVAAHLVSADRFVDLDTLLCQEKDGALGWYAAHDDADTLHVYSAAVAAVLGHYQRLTDEALVRGRLAPTLVRELHYQLVRASLGSRGGTITPRLLEVVAETGAWSPQRALAHVRRIPEPADQITAMALLVPHFPEEERPEVVARALALADAGDEPARWQVIGTLAPHLSEEQLNRYLTRVTARCDKDFAITAFCRLVPHLSGDGLGRALAVAKWLALEDDEHRPLTALQATDSIPAVPSSDEEIARLSTMLSQVTDDEDRAPLMVERARHQPAEQRRAVIAQVHNWTMGARHTRKRGALLIMLAEHLEPDELTALLNAVAAIPTDSDRAEVLAALAPKLPPDRLTRARRIAESIVDGVRRGQALAELAVCFPSPDERASVAASAMAATVGRASKTAVVRVKAALAAQLPAPSREAVLDDVLTAFEASYNEYLLPRVLRLFTDEQFARLLAVGGSQVMEFVAMHGPPALLTPIMDKLVAWGNVTFAQTAEKMAHLLSAKEASRLAAAVATFDDAEARGRALCALGPYVPVGERPAVASAALAALTEKSKPAEYYLAKLLPQLTVDELDEVLALAKRLTAQRGGAQVLRGLALTMPVDRLAEVRAVAGALTSAPDRGGVLKAMLPRLSADQRAQVCEEEVEAATTAKYPHTILMWLASSLPPRLHAKALGIVSALGPLDAAGTGVLRDLAPYLSEEDMEVAIEMAQTAKKERWEDLRVKALAYLLPYLSERRRAEIFDEMLTADLPLDLVPHLTAGELARACDVMRLGQDKVAKALLVRAAELGDHPLYLRILRSAWRSDDRNECLELLYDCFPVLRELAGVEFGPQMLESLDDVHRWWP